MSKRLIYAEDAMDALMVAVNTVGVLDAEDIKAVFSMLPSAQPEPREVAPHRNYRYLSDYWCECGWHLGKKGDVKYCPDCGRKVKWDG